ncbi:MAG TPA: hypothetical protein VNY73_04435 [Bacteroidia bacterium]|jgi:hypothetical protein|nr:hypothetical protein [Bacteroidia bacterium]
MLKRLLILFCLCTGFIALAQEKISQPDLMASYELPADWKVQQYFKESWDKPGGSGICKCALSVNILKVPNGADFDYLYMVVYPSDKKGSTDAMRSQVWQYKITHGEKGDSLHTPNLQWIQYTGKLTCVGENRFKDCIAWKYVTHNQKAWYTVYFWAKPALLAQYKDTIGKIITGFKSI